MKAGEHQLAMLRLRESVTAMRIALYILRKDEGYVVESRVVRTLIEAINNAERVVGVQHEYR